MDLTEDQGRLLALCAIRIDKASPNWNLLAREALLNGMDDLWNGTIHEYSADAEQSLALLREGLKNKEALFSRVQTETDAAGKFGAKLLTVLDQEYPANLRLVPNLPPFLFYKGELADSDVRSVAVVGTRLATKRGQATARRLSTLLAEENVTVTSGLAKGIDAEAHWGAIEAGGRTIAVLGTGITKVYPAEHEELAETITKHGALVSQFWPTRPPGRDTFPRRNVVTSGISQGTVVIEASATSGAKMQARLALEHGKKVFLIKSLVTSQPWAQAYLGRGAIEIEDVQDVIPHLASPERVKSASAQQAQLSLALL